MRRLAALAAVVFWGLSFVASKAALRELTPTTLVFARWPGRAGPIALLAARRIAASGACAVPMLLLPGSTRVPAPDAAGARLAP